MTSVIHRAERDASRGLEPSSPTVGGHKRRWPATGLRWLALVVGGVLTLELTCRIEDWVMYRMPVFSRFENASELVVRDKDGMHGRANVQFEKWHMNNVGTRGPDVAPIAGPGIARIITVGASETFGLRESPEKEFPRQLEDSIRARVGRGECGPNATGRFEVLNAAFPGMTVPTITQDLQNRLGRLHPQIVVAYPSATQYLDVDLPSAAEPDSSPHAARPPVFAVLRPRVVERIREQVKLLLPEWVRRVIRVSQKRRFVNIHPAGWQFTSVPPDRVVAFETDLRLLIGTIRRIGAEPVLGTHANLSIGRSTPDLYALVAWEKFYPRATGETIMAFDSVAKSAMMKVAADSNVVVVDAAKRLASAPASAFADFVHFTDLGSSHMADIVSQGVVSAARAKDLCRPSTTSRAETGSQHGGQ